jgi:dihydropteroate synthase
MGNRHPFPPRPNFHVPIGRGRALELGGRPLVMGILNVTPDSFAERGPRLEPAAAVDAALKIESDGADVVDVGGESTRPGAESLTEQDELARVLPVIRGLADQLRIPISIDTWKADVARAALDAGASVVNDVSGLHREPALARAVTEHQAGLVLMHSRGTPATMADYAVYDDLVAELVAELAASIETAVEAGVAVERIVVDPGVGFAKRPRHSYGVLARLPDIAARLGRPVLVGASRKSFMREALNDRPAFERDWGTAAAVTASVLAGAHIVRVHAVAEMVQVVRVAEEIRRYSDQQLAISHQP